MMQRILKGLRNKTSFSIKGSGSSMGGIIRDGDIVEVKKKSFSTLEINDIAVIYVKKKLITHRVIYKTKSYFITKGDANTIADGRIYPSQVIGIVNHIKRNGREIRINDTYLIQSSYYFKEITKIVHEFKRSSIPYVILKGLPLHLFYEGEHPKRIYADIDFLIKREQVASASRALEKLGFKAQKQSLSKTHAKLKNHHVEIAFTKQINGWYVTVDLHSEPAFLMTQLGDMSLLYPSKLLESLTEEFISNAKDVKLYGNKIQLLSPPYLFIYLSLHFFHHNLQGVFRLDLINRVVKKMSFSPRQQTKIISTIKTYKLENYMLPSLQLLQRYFPETKTKTNKILLRLPISDRQSPISRFTPSIFNNEGRIEGGIRRFILLFLASPQPFWKKFFVFFQPSVLFSVWWVLQRRISSFSKNQR